MGLPDPPRGWQSPRPLVPRSEQKHPHCSRYTLLQNLKPRFFADKGGSLRPRQIPRMLRREDRYRVIKPQQSEHMKIIDPETLNDDQGCIIEFLFSVSQLESSILSGHSPSAE